MIFRARIRPSRSPRSRWPTSCSRTPPPAASARRSSMGRRAGRSPTRRRRPVPRGRERPPPPRPRARRRGRHLRAQRARVRGRVPRRRARRRHEHDHQRALHRSRARPSARSSPAPGSCSRSGRCSTGRCRPPPRRRREVFAFDGERRRRPRFGLLGAPDGAAAPALDPATPGRAALLERHHRPAEGRDAHPSQPGGQHRCRTPAARARRGDDTLAGAAVLPHLRPDGGHELRRCAAGATIVTVPRFDLEEFLRMIEEHRVDGGLRRAADRRSRCAKHPAVERLRPLEPDAASSRAPRRSTPSLEAACRAHRVPRGPAGLRASPRPARSPTHAAATTAPAGHDRAARAQHRGPDRRRRHG